MKMFAKFTRTQGTASRLDRVFEQEYFTTIEPYLSYLRQPVGWLVVAAVVSLLVGLTIEPQALSLAAGLLALIFVGLAYPWLAVRMTYCELVPEKREIVEDEPCAVQLRIRNACPWPLWGLIIEDFVASAIDDAADHLNDQPSADIALGTVPWLSQATCGLTLQPPLRGRYPRHSPQLTCNFPFGLWKASFPIRNITPLVVRPKQVTIVGFVEQSGLTAHHCGDGARSGGHGDFFGIRDYRVGDAIRHIHWAHTAKLDSLVVCERGASEQVPWRVELNTFNPSRGDNVARTNLAWRVRLAASFCSWLHQQSIDFCLMVDGMEQTPQRRSSNRSDCLQQALEVLTNVPLDGLASKNSALPLTAFSNKAYCLGIGPIETEVDGRALDPQRHIHLRLTRSTDSIRRSDGVATTIIDFDQPVAQQINAWLQRIQYVSQAA